ncbi:AraC family transcriptional regulator, partial [Streptomyces sp. NPDC056682]
MRSDEAGPGLLERDAGAGWEVALPDGGTSLGGVQMAGFRDRVAVGFDKRALPQPAVVVVIGLGDDAFTVEGGGGGWSLRSFAATLLPGPARIRGRRVECIEMRLSPPAAYALLGAFPSELGRSVISLEDVWGRHEQLLREQLTEGTTWQ